MDQELIQRARYILRSRIRRLKKCPIGLLIPTSIQFNNWLQSHPLFNALILELEQVESEFRNEISKIREDRVDHPSAEITNFYSATSLKEHAALCYEIVKNLTLIDQSIKNERLINMVYTGLATYLSAERIFETEEAIEIIRDVAIDGLYEYLDEEIDFRNSIYLLLLKYKQRSEWFRRNRLASYIENGIENKTGEKGLAINLQEYILDQGVEFFVEPNSSSGEADLVLRDSDGRYIIIDAKLIRTDDTESKIIKTISDGFHQVYRYCEDYSEDSGFLVSFNQSKNKINLGIEELHGFKYLKFGGKIIYHQLINIAEMPSASKSGKTDEIIIEENDITNKI
mgnify:CR=1 FL=1